VIMKHKHLVKGSLIAVAMLGATVASASVSVTSGAGTTGITPVPAATSHESFNLNYTVMSVKSEGLSNPVHILVPRMGANKYLAYTYKQGDASTSDISFFGKLDATKALIVALGQNSNTTCTLALPVNNAGSSSTTCGPYTLTLNNDVINVKKA
jgi:hypothetical protein